MGDTKYPYGTSDVSAYLVQAAASGAQVLGFANSGRDMENAFKQTHEFGIEMRMAPLLMLIMDVHSIGLEVAQGARFSDSFYWDLNDKTRAWSKRFFEAEQHMPTAWQVDAYRSVWHYLMAIKETGSTDALTVVQRMKQDPIVDALGDGGKIRQDGRVLRDLHYVQIKSPAESKYPWDYYKVLRDIPADEIYRPLNEGGCPFVQK
jgi:branched-chain amino acid transport system substrate-binding protein